MALFLKVLHLYFTVVMALCFVIVMITELSAALSGILSRDSVRNVLGELHKFQLICFLLVHTPMKK